jgi:hypothetical protein
MSVTFTSDRSEQVGLVDLFRDLFRQVTELFTIQTELVKTEAKVEGRKLLLVMTWGLVLLTVASIFLLFLGVSIILMLAQTMGYMWASVVSTGFYLVLTIVSALVILFVMKRNSAKIDV